MFNKILIANRGEIACRVIKTARRLGIKTVAVYSEADAGARHVRLADEAVFIGPAACARELPGHRQDHRRGEADRRPGHPPGLRLPVRERGVLPQPATRPASSSSARRFRRFAPWAPSPIAKKLMEKAGVPLTPGYHGDHQEPGFLNVQADAIGYPVLIKAAAGGGGKGMRLVEKSEDFLEAALASCRREAAPPLSADENVLVEKYLMHPRHIEIQVFGDVHGNVVYAVRAGLLGAAPPSKGARRSAGTRHDASNAAPR
jgi:3-methylcrotonyl-CoA carboxylase alpha subunit